MARIRTVKPEMAKHELLFELEQELQAPVRFAWALLPCHCDRDGRFKWRPRALKTDILPYDECDFSRVLDAWLTRGMIVKYRVGHEWYGCIPTFLKHQSINARESTSTLPAPADAEEILDHTKQQPTDACPTREPRVNGASRTQQVHARGEGKGREGKGTGREGVTTADSRPAEFTEFWSIYPKRSGSNPQDRALKAIRARLRDGHAWSEILDGARRYQAYARATSKERTEYVMQAATFCGPDKHFLEPWELPATKADQRLGSNLTAAAEAKRQLLLEESHDDR